MGWFAFIHSLETLTLFLLFLFVFLISYGVLTDFPKNGIAIWKEALDSLRNGHTLLPPFRKHACLQYCITCNISIYFIYIYI